MIIVAGYVSPCGELRIGSLGDRCCLCDWVGGRSAGRNLGRLSRILGADFAEGTSDVTAEVVRQLDEYFSGERRKFDVPLLLAGTDFQKRVWKQLESVPYGRTVTYAAVASAAGCPRALRAVAGAVGSNALSILVPCHRVTGSGGALTGYAGGLDAKRRLLELEGKFSACGSDT